MKKTFYLMMLAAALTGAQAFGDSIPTTIGGDGGYYTLGEEWDGDNDDQDNGTGFSVTVTADEQGADVSGINVYGAIVVNVVDCTSNTILMQGGQIGHLVGGSSFADANVTNNKVIMVGGTAMGVRGAEHNGFSGTLANNEAIIVGGIVELNVSAAINDDGVAATNNTVRLIGTGAKYENYNGSNITINGDLKVASDGTGNTLEIAGSGIEVDGEISGMQNLNFSLVDGLTSTMLVYNAYQSMMNLDFGGVETYTINGDAVTDWTAYEGKTLTLIESWGAQIENFQAPEGAVEIKAADGSVLATGELKLKDNFTLVLANIHSDTPPVPEPATGTLSLLALAGLCARRRRK